MRFAVLLGLATLAPAPVFAAWTLSPIAQSSSPSAFGFGASIVNGQVVYFQTGAGGPVINEWKAGGTTTLLSTSTAIPLGSGNFSGFSPPSFDGTSVAFQGSGSSGQSGVYELSGSTLTRIADLTTTIPGQAGTFSQFIYVGVSGSTVAFTGVNASNVNGIYSHDGSGLHLVADNSTINPSTGSAFSFVGSSFINGSSIDFVGNGTGGGSQTVIGLYRTSGGQISTVLDTSTSYPGGGHFTSVGDPSVDGTNVASFGASSNLGGVFFKDVGGVISNVADSQHTAPGFTNDLLNIGDGSIKNGSVVFMASDEMGHAGILSDLGGTLAEVLGQGDTLGGKTVQSMFVSTQSFDGSEAVISVNFTDNTSGLYLAALPEPSSAGLLVLSAGFLARRRRR